MRRTTLRIRSLGVLVPCVALWACHAVPPAAREAPAWKATWYMQSDWPSAEAGGAAAETDARPVKLRIAVQNRLTRPQFVTLLVMNGQAPTGPWRYAYTPARPVEAGEMLVLGVDRLGSGDFPSRCRLPLTLTLYTKTDPAAQVEFAETVFFEGSMPVNLPAGWEKCS